METIQEKARKEVRANYSFFKKKSAELEKKHHGKFVLLHQQQIKGYYDTDNDAMTVGKRTDLWGREFFCARNRSFLLIFF